MTRPHHKPHEHLSDLYKSDSEKTDYLNQLFNVSSHQYDRILKYGFFGTGGAYRRRTIENAGLRPDMRVLDVACGTGGVLWEAARTVPPDQLTGVDPSHGMLEASRAKLPGVTFLEGSAEAIPVPDNSHDLLVMGYALRHVRTFEEAFEEFYRVLKPGGKVLILELSRPKSRVGCLFLKLYLKYYIPFLALLLCRNRDAPKMMRYFWDSIEVCVDRETILRCLEAAGFQQCRNDAELRIFSAFSGVKPADGKPLP